MSGKTIPLAILVPDKAHQIPSTPRLVEDRKRARGILEPVMRMLMMAGSLVSPWPLKIPIQTISTDMKIWE